MANISKEKCEELKNNRLFSTRTNYQGCEMKLIQYNGTRDCIVEFQDKYKARIHTNYACFNKGEVRNPYYKNYYNNGCIGMTKVIDESGKIKKSYRTWRNMIRRCYDSNYYKFDIYGGNGCYVCDEWLIYEEFEKWFDHNYYNCNDEEMHLDKDLIKKNNKCYCPQYCCIIPKALNSLILREKGIRGKYMIGVTYNKRLNKYTSQGNVFGSKKKSLHIGVFDTELEAFYAYKNAKEKYIKEVADKYKNLIPDRIYQALYHYQIDIDD